MAKKSGWHIVGGDGIKASILWDEETDAWTYSSNSPFDRAPQLYRTIPTLYRGIGLIANSVQKVPFALYRGEEQVDASSSWDNTTGYLDNPGRVFRLTSQALDRHGKAYWLKVKNRGGITKSLKWFEPSSVEPRFNETTGELQSFIRTDKNGKQIAYKPEDILYFWLDDPDVEIGPPLSYPCKAAMQSAGVLHNLDEFINAYFRSGAVRPMAVFTKGFPPEEEKNRLKLWLNNIFLGLRNAFRAGIFNADFLDFKTIGDGLDQLQNQELTEDQRKDIATALGIPQTILFANSANYATSQSDWLNFHETTIIPRCEFIAGVFNEQLFKAESLELRFEPQGLDIYREDENQRAGALGQLKGAGVPLLMAMDLLGYDLTPEQRAELEAAEKSSEEQAEEMQEQMQQQPPEQEEPEGGAPPMTPEADAEAKHWRRVCNKALRQGQPLPVDFVCEHIPAEQARRIAEALKVATDGDGIKGAFEGGAAIPLPDDWPVSPDLVLELKLARELLERVTR